MSGTSAYLFVDKFEGLQEPSRMAGRQRYRDSFAQFLDGKEARSTRVWIISGVRRIGKTSLTEWFRAEAERGRPQSAIVVQIDGWWKERLSMPFRSLRVRLAREMLPFARRKALWRSKFWTWWSLERVTSVPKLGSFALSDLDLEDFVAWLRSACDELVEDLGNVVIFCDKLSESDADGKRGESGRNVTAFCNLARKLEEMWPRDAGVRLALVGVVLPRWAAMVGTGSRPFGAVEVRLEPFTIAEVRQMVAIGHELSRRNWQVSEDFVDELYRLTGGFPQLCQKLGYLANRQAEAAERTEVSVSDLKDAWTDEEFEAIAHLQMKEPGYVFPSGGPVGATRQVLAAFGATSGLSDEQVEDGVLKDEWMSAVRGQVALPDDEFGPVFSEVFSYLEDAHFLRRDKGQPEKFRFTPVRLRGHLKGITEEMRKDGLA